MAIKVLDLELDHALTDITLADCYKAVWLVVRWHGYPLGYVKLSVKGGCIRRNELQKGLVEQIGANLSAQLTARLLAENGLQPRNFQQFQSAFAAPIKPNHQNLPDPPPMITVAICTRDRPGSLAQCLTSFAALDYPNFEVLVVDNAPQTEQSAKLVQNWPSDDPLATKLRYVIEPRPGVSWGRNRAIVEAKGEIVAFADDDVSVDKGWLAALARAFADPSVGCVTGLIVPDELETPAQELFEIYGGFGRGFISKYYLYGNQTHPVYPLGTGLFGTGANAAYRCTIFAKTGDFETFFGPGTATGGSEDHDMFFKVLKHGYALVYQPAALIRHRHRRDMAGLTMQLSNFGKAEMAFMTHLYLTYPEERHKVRLLLRWWFLEHGLRRLIRAFVKRDFPIKLILSEMWGSLGGVAAYFRARRTARQIAAGQFEVDKLAGLWKEGEGGN